MESTNQTNDNIVSVDSIDCTSTDIATEEIKGKGDQLSNDESLASSPPIQSGEAGKTIPINLTGDDSPSDKPQRQRISINLTGDCDAFEEASSKDADAFEEGKESSKTIPTPINLLDDSKTPQPELQASRAESKSTDMHKHHDHCSGTDHGETYENDKYFWTESCQIIEPFLPPSLSACYLYVRDKTKQDATYSPGVSIINAPTENRPPEIFVCAVKCANTNEINFIYAKKEAVNSMFEGKLSITIVNIKIYHFLTILP